MSTNSGFTAAVALRCAMLVATANYREAGSLGEGLLTLYATTGDPIAGAAGYYNRAVAAFMDGDLDAALRAADDLVDNVPAQTQDKTSRSTCVCSGSPRRCMHCVAMPGAPARWCRTV
ncbi:hypothetical protein [Williamsia sp. 1135]|uniref:hypothetical protein n=1 Tax=Williamsia sp. 1135 TaxID=1889262 RepID=UPI00117D904D|nr:hypothetical protein [Williamsia sp. 1135]